MALALLDAGWHVALAGRRQEALRAVAEQSGALARTLVVPTDVSDPAAATAAAAVKTGKIRVLLMDWVLESRRIIDYSAFNAF